MTVPVNRPVPDLGLEAYVPGEPGPRRISLADYRGGWVVLFWYPRDFTAACASELRALAELEPAFAHEGAVVLAAGTDGYWSHRAWLEASEQLEHVGFPVLADTARSLCRELGVLLDDGSAARATFVIDPRGVVQHLSVSGSSAGRSPEETLRVLQVLQAGQPAPVTA